MRVLAVALKGGSFDARCWRQEARELGLRDGVLGGRGVEEMEVTAQLLVLPVRREVVKVRFNLQVVLS